ncbi:hypothetical protein [Lachnoclostridium phytofermentans]
MFIADSPLLSFLYAYRKLSFYFR